MSNELNPPQEYAFRLKKGELELEVRSNDKAFMQAQMDSWRSVLVQPAKPPVGQHTEQPSQANGSTNGTSADFAAV